MTAASASARPRGASPSTTIRSTRLCADSVRAQRAGPLVTLSRTAGFRLARPELDRRSPGAWSMRGASASRYHPCFRSVVRGPFPQSHRLRQSEGGIHASKEKERPSAVRVVPEGWRPGARAGSGAEPRVRLARQAHRRRRASHDRMEKETMQQRQMWIATAAVILTVIGGTWSVGRNMATRDDVAGLAAATRDDVAGLAAATREDVAGLAAATREDVERVRADVGESPDRDTGESRGNGSAVRRATNGNPRGAGISQLPDGRAAGLHRAAPQPAHPRRRVTGTLHLAEQGSATHQRAQKTIHRERPGGCQASLGPPRREDETCSEWIPIQRRTGAPHARGWTVT